MSRIADAAVSLANIRPDIRGKRRQMMLGHVNGESGYGFRPPFNKTPDGSPSHNWGAIYAKGDKGSFKSVDTSEGKTVYPQAAWNSSAEVGAQQYVNLIQYSYPEAYEAAGRGDAWGFAKGLWRKGPGSSAPSYYEGFPPGDKRGVTPKGVKPHSPLDHYYRILAYAMYVNSQAPAVASALGETNGVYLKAPQPPKGGHIKGGASSSGGMLGALVIVAGGGWLVTRSLGSRS